MNREAGFTAILVTSDVEEASVLASRVIVLTKRAARLKAEFRVELSLPETPGRSRASRHATPNPRDSRARRMRPRMRRITPALVSVGVAILLAAVACCRITYGKVVG
jgi:ABC-type nitrate/sulfonate/bicarbonate transport system ATPase subunit